MTQLQLFKEVINTGQGNSYIRNVNLGGSDAWFSITNTPLNDDRLVHTWEDVSQQKRLEDKRLSALMLLLQSEKFASIGSWDYDLLTGNFSWSDGMYRLFNMQKEKQVTPDIYMHYATADCYDIAARISGNIKRGDIEFEESLTIDLGEMLKVLKLKATIIKNDEGYPIRVLGIDMDITATKVAEEKLRRLEAEQQMEIFRVTLRTQEEERRRISESLHNGLGQLLYGIKISMNELTSSLAQNNDKAYNSFKQYTEELLTEAIKESRRISHELMPIVLDEFGLAAAVKDICQQLQNGLKFNCKVQLKGVKLDKYFELAVYRTVQELMLNVVKHAEATTGNIDISVEDGRIMIRVEDNGKGFALTKPDKLGIGLASIRSKANLLNGSVDIITSPGKGTVVEVWLEVDNGKS